MSITRIWGVLLQELYITKRSLEVFMDLFFFTAINVLAFGLVSKFLFSGDSFLAGEYLLGGFLFWEVLRITQYSMSVGAMWNVWSKNLSNMFISPLTTKEYLTALMLSGLIKAVFIFIGISIMSLYFFNFNIFKIGLLNLFASYINLTFFAWSLGIIILGIIFRYGTRIQALAWGLIFLFQPLTAALFPLSILPIYIKVISYLFPSTYVFEAIRQALISPSFNLQFQTIALVQNILYFLLSIWVFNFLFRRSKETGQFVNNET